MKNRKTKTIKGTARSVSIATAPRGCLLEKFNRMACPLAGIKTPTTRPDNPKDLAIPIDKND
jgi:hypothetical protein